MKLLFARPCRQVRRSTFEHLELVGKRPLNVAEGLELHESILSPAEQALLVETIERWVGLVSHGVSHSVSRGRSGVVMPGR